MASPQQKLISLADITSMQVKPEVFARDNYFNARSEPQFNTSSRPYEVFGHILSVAAVEVDTDLRVYLEELQAMYDQGPTLREPPLEPTSTIEVILQAFDGFAFDKYQMSLVAQTELVADFGRFAVRQAENDQLGKAS